MAFSASMETQMNSSQRFLPWNSDPVKIWPEGSDATSATEDNGGVAITNFYGTTGITLSELHDDGGRLFQVYDARRPLDQSTETPTKFRVIPYWNGTGTAGNAVFQHS